MDTIRTSPSTACLTIKIRKNQISKTMPIERVTGYSSYINRILEKKNIIIRKKILYKLYLVGQQSNFGWYISMN